MNPVNPETAASNAPHAKVPVIALTGNIGSGKSSVAKLFTGFGAWVIDADELARQVVAPGSPALSEIIARFGNQILRPDGSLDRKTLGTRVFNHPEERAALEKIIHPRVRSLFLESLSAIPPEKKMCVYAVPLLFEADEIPSVIDAIVTVYAPRNICIERVTRRDGLSASEAAARYDAQLPGEEKVQRSDYVIRNDGTEEQLKTRVAEVVQRILAPG